MHVQWDVRDALMCVNMIAEIIKRNFTFMCEWVGSTRIFLSALMMRCFC